MVDVFMRWVRRRPAPASSLVCCNICTIPGAGRGGRSARVAGEWCILDWGGRACLVNGRSNEAACNVERLYGVCISVSREGDNPAVSGMSTTRWIGPGLFSPKPRAPGATADVAAHRYALCTSRRRRPGHSRQHNAAIPSSTPSFRIPNIQSIHVQPTPPPPYFPFLTPTTTASSRPPPT